MKTVQVASGIKALLGNLTPPEESLPNSLFSFPFPHPWSAWLPIFLPTISPDGRHLSASWLLQRLSAELEPIPVIQLLPLHMGVHSFYKDQAIWLGCLLYFLASVLIWPLLGSMERWPLAWCTKLSCCSPSHPNSSFLNFTINIACVCIWEMFLPAIEQYYYDTDYFWYFKLQAVLAIISPEKWLIYRATRGTAVKKTAFEGESVITKNKAE